MLVLMIIFTRKVTFLDYLILMLLFFVGFFFFFVLLDIRKHNEGSHGKRKNGNLKRKNQQVLTLSDLSITFKHSGQHIALSLLLLFLSLHFVIWILRLINSMI